jgi:hypothetical protein
MMKKLGVWALSIGAVLWGLFVFLASNSPEDVQSRTSGWLASPLVKALPEAIVDFAASPVVLAITFLILGFGMGWRARKWWARPRRDEWHDLGVGLSLLGHEIDNARWSDDLHQLNADINLMAIKVTRKGLPFPKMADGFKTVQSFLPYVRQVSTFLQAGEVAHAREAARQLSAKPPPGSESGSSF